MAYTTIGSEVVAYNSDGTKQRRVDIVVDTTADLPTVDVIDRNGWSAGTRAWICNENTHKVLNNAKEWV